LLTEPFITNILKGAPYIFIIASIKKFENQVVLKITNLGRKKMAEAHKEWAASFPQGKTVLTENSSHYIQK
jgi:hypothetical protein